MTDDEGIRDFERFDLGSAWRLGSKLVEDWGARGLPMTIGIHLGEQRVFHAALPGATAMNDGWVDRKMRVVRHFDRSSRWVWEHYVQDNPDFWQAFVLDRSQYAPAEGAVPIRVAGVQVGVLSVSGLDTGGDHELAVAALADL
jgi:uncharacterized protein (UPF0303 family)